MNKVMASVEEAVADIPDGASILVGGFSQSGMPSNLIEAVVKKAPKSLTIIAQGPLQFVPFVDAGLVRKLITAYASMAQLGSDYTKNFDEKWARGEIELEHTTLGGLAERIRAGGAGVAAFYLHHGIGTVVEEGKEKRTFSGKECLLEHAIRADFALVKAYKGDLWGNLEYRRAMRGYNPIMGTAANITIAEVEQIVEVGGLDPEAIGTPAAFVRRVVQAAPKYRRWSFVDRR